MTKNYFRNIPDFEYVNRTKDGQFISNYTQVKNFFKRGKLRDDLFQDLTVFEKYDIKGDDRPDNVANIIYVTIKKQLILRDFRSIFLNHNFLIVKGF